MAAPSHDRSLRAAAPLLRRDEGRASRPRRRALPGAVAAAADQEGGGAPGRGVRGREVRGREQEGGGEGGGEDGAAREEDQPEGALSVRRELRGLRRADLGVSAGEV